ncbi:MAG: hypothetical protein ABIS50_08825 [Luteolibacter sp.]|uniref:hypothetical protein n=1 Tax=Luteolibacter sp. TaxID=1962973 RepID=UPI003263DBC0
MKVLSVLLAATLAAQAAPSDPGKVAIDFLEKVRDRKLNLDPGGDTALSAQTAVEKRRQIAKRLEKMARDLGTDPLEVGAIKLDEDFAAVLIRKVGNFDPSHLQVFPVALVKRDTGWEAAPVPASFENSGAGYAIALQKRIEQLENWMLREQVVDLEKLRVQSNSRMRGKIEASLSETDLRKFDVEKTGNRFLTACETGDLGSLLGVLGGLSGKLPDDWSARLKSAENAITAGAAAPRPWRLMVSPDVARVVVDHETDGDTGLVSIGCLDPVGIDGSPARIEVIYFPLSKSSDGLWRIDPPASYLHEKEKSPAGQANPRAGNATDTDPANSPAADKESLFAGRWTKTHPTTPQPSAELAAQAWLAALREGSFQSFLAISKLDTTPETTAKACARAAQTWWTIRGGSADLVMPLSFKADESRAAGIYQFFAARDPDKLDARPVYFEKSPNGWLWTPVPSKESSDGFKTWVETETKHLPDDWQRQVLSACPVVTDVDGLEASTEEETRKCVGDWLDAIRHGDVNAAIARIACLDSPRSGAATLQNLGYEIAGSRGKPELPPITGVYQSKPWSAAGVKMDRDGKSTYPLYTVVKTAQGPRILVEIDLFSSGNRGRDFLNNDALVRLGKSTTEAAETALRDLLKQHQAGVAQSSEKGSK